MFTQVSLKKYTIYDKRAKYNNTVKYSHLKVKKVCTKNSVCV